MLGYECRKCGATKFPDGQGCSCGESHASLKVIHIDKNGKKLEHCSECHRKFPDEVLMNY